MAVNFKTIDSLKPIAAVVAEAGAALQDPSRTIQDSSMPEILGAALGAGAGGAASFAALWALGTTGLSAAGITSALATAGALVGGGMVAGIGVLAAPAVILATTGYAIFSAQKKKKLMYEKQELYKEVVKKYNAIIKELEEKASLQEDRIKYLQSLLIYLEKAMKDLKNDIVTV
ncbi:hypothetical protein [Mailhella massiliensis]|uniref:hypothetical protein n=1 Tax=Mailhella massiliensis TaxID=1903261 RepID=UPI002355A43C|nr:hypothetical protein [Mailhella massiliensis]